MASLQKNYLYRKKKEKYQEISDMVLIDDFLFFSQPGKISANYAQTECQFRYCGTAIPFLTVRSTAR